MLHAFLKDECAAVVSGDLVLVMTFVVLGLIVGLVELQDAIVNELNDVGEAIGSLNQSFFAHGKSSRTPGLAIKARSAGSRFDDHLDDCDRNECAITCDLPTAEVPKAICGAPPGP